MHAVILDAETIAFVDVTAAQMLDQLAGDLRRRGVRLMIARDVGLVRDVLDRVAVRQRAARRPPERAGGGGARPSGIVR